MKKIALLTLPFCLAACEGQENSAAEETPDVSVTDAGMSMAADGAPPAGMYRAVGDDGSVLIEDLREDGTYTFSDEEGAVIEEGAYIQKSPTIICFTANTQGAVEICYADAIGDDGVWRTTDPNTGVVSVIERIDVD